MPEVVFTPSGRRGAVASGTTVLDAARMLGVDLDSVCAGRGICGRCQVTLGSRPGIPADPTRLSSPAATELDYRGRKPLVPGRRLGCAARILDDVVIDVPADSQVHRQVVRKRPEAASYPVDPVCRPYYVEVDEPRLDTPSGDFERLCAALAAEWDLHDLSINHAALRELGEALRQGKWAVTVVVRDGHRVVSVRPGYTDRLLGVAVDVGSTTLAGHLCDLTSGELVASTGRMNPQIGFGEDLMSRVSYVMMTPGGADQLTRSVREALSELVLELCAEVDADPGDVLELVVVGNPIMHHLVLGLDPTELGAAPFALVTASPLDVWAPDLGLPVHPSGRVHTLPCIAGHVGADTAAAVLSEGPHRRDPIQLLVDVGTNAELVLGNRDRLLAASSPTGPAFEGAQISSGQRAAPGAIERVRIDPDTLEPRFKVIGCDLWSDEEGFHQAVAEVGVTGICGSGIIEAIAELYLAGVITPDGTLAGLGRSDRIIPDGRTFSYVLWVGDRSVGGHRGDIVVTQSDVRAIQLAKAALYAGARLLMDHLGVDAVDEIRLAGAFGAHIDPYYAMVLGMIPDCDLDRVSAAGNAAGTGAVLALLSAEARAEIAQVARDIVKVETATEPRFQEHFVGAMGIPHRDEPFPHLSSVVTLPREQAPTGGRRGRRKRRDRSEEDSP